MQLFYLAGSQLEMWDWSDLRFVYEVGNQLKGTSWLGFWNTCEVYHFLHWTFWVDVITRVMDWFYKGRMPSWIATSISIRICLIDESID